MAASKVPKKPLKSMKNLLNMPISQSKKIKKKNYQRFSLYLYKLLRNVDQDNLGISRKSMLIVNNFENDILEKITVEARRLVAHGKKTTMSRKDVQSAIRLLIPVELATHANKEEIRAVSMIHKSKCKSKNVTEI